MVAVDFSRVASGKRQYTQHVTQMSLTLISARYLTGE
jgi:hypothetical protein